MSPEGDSVPQPRRVRPGDRIVRRPRLSTVLVPIARARPTARKPISPLVLFYAYVVFIAVGTSLLWLPWATTQPGFTPFMTALFTSASAATVTGLTVTDTPTYWSLFGQGVILVLIQVGGLGIMTMSTLLFIIIGRRISLRERLAIREATGVTMVGGVVRLIRQIGLFVLIAELLGVVLLTVRFSGDLPLGSALWNGLFHSVSAFNNAGFSILSTAGGLEAYRVDPAVLLPLAALIMAGGISTNVVVDLLRKRRFSRLALDTKIVLAASVALWGIGMAVFLFSEYSNPQTLGSMDVPGKLLSSFFHSVSTRTAGFAAVPMLGVREYTLFVIMGLMFVGAVAGSTGGGIRVNTFATVVASVVGVLRGRPSAEAFGREIPNDQVGRAVTLVALAMLWIFVVVFLLTIVEGGRFIDLLFETVSAFGTNGLSHGATPTLGVVGQVLIIATMVVGKVGPLTLILIFAQGAEQHLIRYPQERVRIG